MDDPIERLKNIGQEVVTLDEIREVINDPVPDLRGLVKPVPDGVFPKKIVIRVQSTGEVVDEIRLINKGETGRLEFERPFIPQMSGNYILEISPEAIIEPEVEDHGYYPDC